jgi:hypothetical protein
MIGLSSQVEGLYSLMLDDATQGSTSSPASVSTFHEVFLLY